MSALPPHAISWTEDRAADALVALARASGLAPRLGPAPVLAAQRHGDAETASRFLEHAAAAIGIEAEPVQSDYGEIYDLLTSMAPAMVAVPDGKERRYLAVLSSGPKGLVVLTPALTRASLSLAALESALTGSLAEKPSRIVDAWLSSAGLTGKRAERARSELLKYLLTDRAVGGIWLLRSDPGSDFAQQLRARRAPARLALFFAASLAQVAIAIAGWTTIGWSVLGDSVQTGWLYAWILLALTGIPCSVLASHVGGALMVDLAALLKQRLLRGALRLDPASIRERGSGGLLALVSESEAVESAGLSGAMGVIIALAQLVSAAGVLYLGAGGWLHVLLLVAWCALLLAIGGQLWRRRQGWSEERFAITNLFVEHVVGHRTRVAQQAPGERHRHEERQLEHYAASGRSMDEAQRWLSVLASRGWLAVGLAGLTVAILSEPRGAISMAIAMGGILQAQMALPALVQGASTLVGAAVAWRSIAPLFHAAGARERPGALLLPPRVSSKVATAGDDVPLLDARRLVFRHRVGGAPILEDCNLTIREGDRVLLEGRSGGGKSTLLSLLSGLRAPSGGVLLLRGLDVPTVGASEWRRRVASAPQFHENHILSGTLAFNLLMGRGWPASDEDLRDAHEVCRALGLGPLIARMPSGLSQIVGETGWQLSHGERSRVFLARALLQRADVILLDETFGALDPVTLEQCLDAVLARAPALIVVAHP